MSAKKRKPQEDTLTSKFVDNQNEKPDSEHTENQGEAQPESEHPQPAKSKLMSQLTRTTPREPTVRFTLDLTESMHRNLSVLAAKTGRKKAEIVRLLLDEALKEFEE